MNEILELNRILHVFLVQPHCYVVEKAEVK